MSNEKEVSGKCNAKTRDGGYCANPPVTGSKRCRMHGGTNPGNGTGKDNSNYRHGLFAEVGVNEDERELMEAISEIEDIEKYDVLLERELARYLRALDVADGPGITPDFNQFGERIGESLDMNDEPLADRAGLISGILDKKSRAEHRLAKIDDGVKQRVEQSLDDDSQSALLDAVGSLEDDE